MKDRPILFSAPMVRAILAGTKTQTRREVKWKGLKPGLNLGFSGLRAVKNMGGFSLESDTRTSVEDRSAVTPCPYGQPGDRLWVRETFFAWGRWETRYSAKKGRDEWHFVDMTLECGKAYEYPATGGQPQPMGGARHRGGTTPTWWKRPAIHMPRAASRITLEITSVRVERLQEISDMDALAEGVDREQPSYPKLKFSWLWKSINGPQSWDANPWVWAITFNRIESTT